jgi:uncharacterized membrane protein YphA (DoxX/SURF4 family)
MSTSIEKFKSFEEHVHKIRQYQILPARFARFFAYIDVTIESIIGVFLLFGLFLRFTSMVALGILIIYSFAIMINLFRGRVDLSCGCGGLIGSEKISWNMVIRNILACIALILIFRTNMHIGNMNLIGEHSLRELFPFQFFVIFFITTTFTIFYSIHNKMQQVEFNIKR